MIEKRNLMISKQKFSNSQKIKSLTKLSLKEKLSEMLIL